MKKKRTERNGMARMTVLMTSLALLTVPVVLSGCRKAEPVESSSVEAGTEAKESKAEEPEKMDWKEATATAEGSANRMVESGGHLFFKYKNGIYKIDEKTEALTLLREFEDGEENGSFWVYRGGLYYDVSVSGTQGESSFFGLYRMDLETGTEEHLSDLMALPTEIYASEDKLYIRGYDMNIVYALDNDGKTKGELSPTETVYSQIPDGCRELFSGVLPYYLDHCGYMPVQNDTCLVIADTDGSNPREVTEVTNTSSVLFAENCFFAVFSDGSGNTQCWRYEADSLEKTLVFESSGNPQPVQYRDGVLYYMEYRDSELVTGDTAFYQIAADRKTAGTSEPKEIMTMKEEPGMTGEYTYYGNFYASGTCVYGQQISDYGVYIGKEEVGQEEPSLLQPALFQSPILKLGHVEGEHEEISCACGAYTAVELYTEKMVFEGDGEAVEAMNRTMEERRQQIIQSAGSNLSAEDEEWIHQQAERSRSNTLTYVIDGSEGITYCSDRYLSIMASGYEYTGGAHGMPFREYFVFDRETGARLALSDIVETPVEELQEKVGAAFRALAEKTNFAFESPEDLEHTVSDDVSYESPFFITEAGIAFYYDPYVIASYAEGFPQVVIPYEELELKIALQ